MLYTNDFSVILQVRRTNLRNWCTEHRDGPLFKNSVHTEVGVEPNRPILWIFLSDDDTILSISRVREVLGCFDHTADLYLGERYGFRLHSDDGFNYITGGSGIAFSLPTVRKIVQSCSCPTISSPDDMILSSCFFAWIECESPSSRFHQARPMDYAQCLLTVQKPVSFHKFWQLDPFSVYEEWFAADDARLYEKSKRNLPRMFPMEYTTRTTMTPTNL